MKPLSIAMLGVKSVPAVGGISRYTAEMGSRLVERGHDVTVYCRPHYLDDLGCDSYQGMERRVCKGLRGKHLDAFSHTLTSAIDTLRRDHDIVHLHGVGPGFAAPLVRSLSGKRTVLTVHGLDWQRAKWGPVARWVMRNVAGVAFRSSHHVTAVSQLMTGQLVAQGIPTTHTPPGMRIPDIMPPLELADHGLSPKGYVLMATRLVPEKGIHFAIEAFERLNTGHTLVIAGDCPYDSDYVRELKSHASDHIRFLGYVSGRLMEELNSHALVFLQPSLLEGLSIALVEALSYGRCVVASDIPENVEALGGQGFTFRSGDVDDLTRVLGRLLNNPEIAGEQYDPARAYVARKFDWERTTDLFEGVYDYLSRCRRGRPSGETVLGYRNCSPPMAQQRPRDCSQSH
jgi:glycosyltransferase involved in cell wall biosynthesis